MSSLVRLGLGVALFLGTAEVTVRALDPAPRVQVVDRAVIPWRLQDGVPLWSHASDDDPVLARPPCVDGPARQVVLAGDSVLRVGAYDEARRAHPDVTVRREGLASNVALRLQDRLDAAPGAWCVRNVAQSGFYPYQIAAAARRAHEDRPIDVLVLEVFKVDERFTVLGERLYGFDRLARNDAGLPVAIPLPDALHGALFEHVATYRYATLALAPEGPLPRPPDQAVQEALDWAEAEGIEVVLLSVPILDRPFAASAGDHPFPAVAARARPPAVRWVDVAARLAERDVVALRLDTCCHYGAEGHEALGAILADELLGDAPR